MRPLVGLFADASETERSVCFANAVEKSFVFIPVELSAEARENNTIPLIVTHAMKSKR